MIALKYLFYPLLFLTGIGNSFCSAAADRPAPRVADEGMAQEHFAFIDEAGIFDLFDEGFSDLIIEEDFTEGGDDEGGDGHFFHFDNASPLTGLLPEDALHAGAPHFPSVYARCTKDAPIYLLNRTFLI